MTEKGKAREVSFEPVLVQPARSAEPPRPLLVSAPATLQPNEGRYFLLFLDDTPVSSPVCETLRQKLASFLSQEVKDGDWVTIVAPEQHLWWTARTRWEHRQTAGARPQPHGAVRSRCDGERSRM